MKKVLFALSAALVLFSACQEKEGPAAVEFALTDQMIEVDVEDSYNVVVDAVSRTVAIEVAYADKAALANLSVTFVNLPEGVAVEDAELDLAEGATATVTFTKEGTEFVYTFSATYAQPNPRFTGLTLVLKGEAADGSQDIRADVAGGVAKFKSGTDLSSLVVEYTVAPEGTTVTVGDTPVVSGTTALNFSDKANGVTFNLSLEGVTNTVNVKAKTTGISTIYRKWGRFVSPVSDDATPWYAEADNKDLASAGGAIRNIAIDADYVYMTKNGSANLFAVSVADGSFVKSFSTNGISQVIEGGIPKVDEEDKPVKIGEVHAVSDVEVMYGEGSNKEILVCNLVNSDKDNLRLYAYLGLDADPLILLDYPLTENVRLGDKMQVEGTLTNGKIRFVDYNSSENRKVYTFKMENGNVNPTPEITTIPNSLPANSICGLYKYSDTEYLWTGTGKASTALFKTYSYSNGTYTNTCDDRLLTMTTIFYERTHDVNFITFNEVEYMVYARANGNSYDGIMKYHEIPAGTNLYEKLSHCDGGGVFSLGDTDYKNFPNSNCIQNGNGCAACAVYQDADKTYVAAQVCGAGVSLFEIK